MNRRRNNTSAAAAALGLTPNANSGLQPPRQIKVNEDTHDPKGPMLLMSGYEAANDSPGRGYIWWQTTDTRRELPQFSDAEIRRRIHWLTANFGAARRLYLGPAKMLGFQAPHPVGPDHDWNDEAFDNFHARAGSPLIFDRKGREDFFTSQVMMNRNKFKDGRILPVFTETSSAGASVAFYEAHQIKNGPTDQDGGKYEQGVDLNKFDRHMGWKVQDGKNPEKFQRIDAQDGHYYGNFEGPGPIHGLSILAHAVMNLHDVVELRGLRKHAAKNAAQLGLAVEKDRAMATITNAAAGLGGPSYTAEIDVDGVKQEIKWDQIATQGHVPHLNPGERIRVVTDDRPTPNNMEFDRALIEDAILGIDLPPAALYYVTGLTGPGVRFNMEEVRRWITLQHRYQAQWCQRYYAIHIAKEIKAGRLPNTPHPYWRQVEWIGLPDMTIDRGRDAAATVTRLDTGLTTWSREYARDGLFGRKEIRSRIRETAMAKQEILKAQDEFEVDLSWDEVFRNWRPSATATEGDGTGFGENEADKKTDDQEEETQ